MNVDALYDRWIEGLKNVHPLSGDHLSTDAGHNAVNLGHTHNDDDAQKESGQCKHGNPCPLRLRRFTYGVGFGLKLPDDAKR
jgi:hypothetical protein